MLPLIAGTIILTIAAASILGCLSIIRDGAHSQTASRVHSLDDPPLDLPELLAALPRSPPLLLAASFPPSPCHFPNFQIPPPLFPNFSFPISKIFRGRDS